MFRSPTSHGQRARRFVPRLEGLEDRTVPTTFTVNSLGDAGAGTGLTGDLRYCVNAANAAPAPTRSTSRPACTAPSR
jgi:hypothetical protein